MAYNEKYFLTYCTPLGVLCRVSIKVDNFVGDATELIGQEDPIKITYSNGDDFKFKPIIESEAEIGFVFDDNTLSFSELWTSNERTFKVEHIVDGVVDWTGFVIPEGFDYNLKGGLYDSVLKARDGLSTLEGILFKTENNQFYGVQDLAYNNGAEFPFILVLTEILKKLDLDIDLHTLVDYYEQTMANLNDNNRNSDPLSVSFVNVKTYVNDTDRKDIAYFEDVNEAWDCKKILENICNIWGARIYQENGVWKFKSIHSDTILGLPLPDYIEDTFVGVNPSKILNFWRFECYYSETSKVYLDTTEFFYSKYNTATINDIVFSDTGVTPALEGYYLIKSTDKLIYINAVGVIIQITSYYPAVNFLYWKKYNSNAAYLGRELAYNNSEIPCNNKDVFLKDNDAVIRMDKVYKQFRVNYDYTFLREGDSPVNLIKNGNFKQDYEQYGGLEAPPSWDRWSLGSYKPVFYQTNNVPYARLRVDNLSGSDVVDTNGETDALTYGVQIGVADTPNTSNRTSPYSGLVQRNLDFNTKVNLLTFSVKVHYAYFIDGNQTMPVFRLLLNPSSNSKEVYVLENVVNDDYDLSFTRYDLLNITSDDISNFFYLDPILHNAPEYKESEKALKKWYTFNVKVAVPNVLGSADFFIHGFGRNYFTKDSKKYPQFPVKYIVGDGTVSKSLSSIVITTDNVYFTGIELAYIPDPNEEIPKSDYIYANGDINYTFQNDPIKVYNGDTTSKEIVSSIIVPSSTSGINKWDAFNNDFGKSDIGMILCKSVMQQYYKPNRLLDLTIKNEIFRYGGVLNLEAIPDINFIMMRGTFNPKKGYWEDCTLGEISNDQIAAGGITNNDSLDPKWIDTGRSRCVKDNDGLNTGDYETEKQDVNTNSESFGDYRWDSQGDNLVSCPIGNPSRYYWGTDVFAYDLINFTDFTITFEDYALGQVRLTYSNSGGKYIYFLHLASLGSVIQVSNQFQSQIISSFTYLADVTINGYLYHVLRQDFVTGEFNDFFLDFYIQ